MAYTERTPFAPRAQWSNDPKSPYVTQCVRAHVGSIAGEVLSPRELTDDALAEAINGMAAQLARIVAQNKADRAAALAEAKQVDGAFTAALTAARAALAPHVTQDMSGGELGASEPATSLVRRADDLLAQAEAQHAAEAAQAVFVPQTTQSLNVALEHCRTEQQRRADRQRAADEAMRASLERLGVSL